MDNSDFRQITVVSDKHQSVTRDYLARVTDPEFPKDAAASLAKSWGFDYWDGDRRVNYGGYYWVPGYWTLAARRLIEEFGLTSSSSVLEIGCGKGFLLRELREQLPGINLAGIDISEYAVENSDALVKDSITVGDAAALPYDGNEFDLAISINTFHNLHAYDLDSALREIQRVARSSFIVVESYRNEKEKANLLYWQVTCEAFLSPNEWLWWFDMTGFEGKYEFIYFE